MKGVPMGLFDSLYDTSNQGGLIDRLLSQLGQGQQLAFSGLPSDQAQYGQQPTLPGAFLQPEGGGIGGFMRGAAANHGAGLVGMALGGIAGAAGMGEGDRHNAQLNAQYRALIDAGVPQQKALLATINPEF